MQTLKKTGTDWRERMISKLYMDHRVKVRLDQEEPRSVQIRREGRHWYDCHQLYSTYTASTLPRKVSKGLMTSNRTSNADDLVLLAMKETVLQGMTDRLTETEWYYGREMNVTKTKLMRTSNKPSPVEIVANRKQLEIQDCQGKSTIQQEEDSFHQQNKIKFRGKKVKVLHWKYSFKSIVLKPGHFGN